MISIDISEEVAARILPILKRDHESLGLQILKIEAKLGIRAKPVVSQEQSDEPEKPDTGTYPLFQVHKGEGGRARKGESEKLIIEYLTSLKGERAAVKEISDRTGAAYGSCVRILRNLKDRHIANSERRLWAINTERNGNG